MRGLQNNGYSFIRGCPGVIRNAWLEHSVVVTQGLTGEYKRSFPLLCASSREFNSVDAARLGSYIHSKLPDKPVRWSSTMGGTITVANEIRLCVGRPGHAEPLTFQALLPNPQVNVLPINLSDIKHWFMEFIGLIEGFEASLK